MKAWIHLVVNEHLLTLAENKSEDMCSCTKNDNILPLYLLPDISESRNCKFFLFIFINLHLQGDFYHQWILINICFSMRSTVLTNVLF